MARAGVLTHNAKGSRLHHLSVDERLRSIDEVRSLPHAIDLCLELERGPVARLHRGGDGLGDLQQQFGGPALPRARGLDHQVSGRVEDPRVARS